MDALMSDALKLSTDDQLASAESVLTSIYPEDTSTALFPALTKLYNQLVEENELLLSNTGSTRKMHIDTDYGECCTFPTKFKTRYAKRYHMMTRRIGKPDEAFEQAREKAREAGIFLTPARWIDFTSDDGIISSVCSVFLPTDAVITGIVGSEIKFTSEQMREGVVECITTRCYEI